jgi:hypothetical protein
VNKGQQKHELALRKLVKNGSVVGRYRFDSQETIVGTEVWFVTDVKVGTEHGPYRFLYEAQEELKFMVR